jgi:hypothetical protein
MSFDLDVYRTLYGPIRATPAATRIRPARGIVAAISIPAPPDDRTDARHRGSRGGAR